jgi:DNA invertase Pin-like site-specific DNA recombinase
MLVGYGRTSTVDQQASIQAQERDLSAAGCDKLFIEQVSSVGKRQQLDAALDYVRDGDTLIVTKLDRLARSVPDLLTMVARLEGKNVALRVLAMSGGQPLDTGTAIGKLMLAVIGAVGQFEREMMLERQREGIAKAKRDGRYKGRAPTVRRRAAEITRLKGCRRHTHRNRRATGDRPRQCLSGAGCTERWRTCDRLNRRWPCGHQEQGDYHYDWQ